jgi:MFS family permease
LIAGVIFSIGTFIPNHPGNGLYWSEYEDSVVEVDSRVSGVYRGWFVVAALFAIWTVIFGIQYSFGVFFRSLQDAFVCSRGTVSLAMTVQLIVFALVMVPAGWINDRFNLRIVTSLAAVGFSLPLALCSLVSEPWHLYVLYGLMGVSTSIYGPPLYAVIVRWFPEKGGLALGITSAGVGFGGDTPQVPALTVQCFGVASIGVIYAFVAALVHITGSLGPLAAGYIFDLTHSYTITFLGAGVLLFLGVFSVSRLK